MSRKPFRRWAVCLALVAAACPAGQHVAAEPAARETRTLVSGGYVNSAGFVPTSTEPTSDPDVYTVTFTGGAQWNGDFTGQTVAKGVATVNVRTGYITGTFTDTFHGTYVPDGRTGTLAVAGTFTSDERTTFVARGRIVRATCGFAGSRGTMEFLGHSLNGGYRGTWFHPVEPPAAATCAS